MTILANGTTVISCDDSIHIGANRFDVMAGTRVAPEEGLRQLGWGVDRKGTIFQCPECRNRRLGKA